ncbi:hypothetical protein V2G26_013790 [Clonostachys chloroleuca]|uniref:PHD and RING finger domain-containing protein n=1 Tax=Clonostachys chloroleuca TaxID=1926264 RepID=A0AA35M273_9HYPO|nr:unnamed protein product [Clonostachys chloroleuca]
MSEPEQCIICLEPLPRLQSSTAVDVAVQVPPPPASEAVAASTKVEPTALLPTPTASTAPSAAATSDSESAASGTITNGALIESDSDDSLLNIVAELDGCEHIIHNACIRSWAQKTNTCPICRKVFHTIKVLNGVDGTLLSTYHVDDKKQVADFDLQQWLVENVEEEEEESCPCPICNSSEREDILLLCDSCDAAYHTHCLGMQEVPQGDWYCMECRHLFQLADDPPTPADEIRSPRPRYPPRPHPRDSRGHNVRTRANLRRARQQARNFEWQGAWGHFAGRFFDLSDVDLDNADEEVEELEQFRRFQQLDRRELQRWQQRVNIANRLGARETFANNIPPQISEYLQPPPIEETVDERRAWGALERAREVEEGTPTNSRKRKTRSVTASPAEPVQEPERKLKRPRTRRLPPQQGEASASASSPVTSGPPNHRLTNGGPATRVAVAIPTANRELNRDENGPPLVSSLLKELEPHAHSEDDNSVINSWWQGVPEASSPALSPVHSAHSSPRALSMTPPPLPSVGGRPTSPTLSLSTHIEPRYPPANYSPTRNSSEQTESEPRVGRPTETRTLELRQPRPRRPSRATSRAEEASPTRATMTPEEKKNINDIVKNALRPHWRAQKLTSDQYATINRDISRKLYEEVGDATALDQDTRRTWEKRVTQEVAQAIAGLSA